MADRQHPASEQRRKKFRDRGEVARSQDLVRFGGLAAGIVGIATVGVNGAREFVGAAAGYFGDVGQPVGFPLLLEALWSGARSSMPVLAIASVGTVGVGLLQTRGLFSLTSLSFKGGRLNPLPKLKKMFASGEAIGGLLLSVLKVFLLASVCAYTLKDEIPALLNVWTVGLGAVVSKGGAMLVVLVLRAVAVLLLVALVDYGVNRFKFEKKMKMTTQEVRDEFKEQHGDPTLISQRKKRQRELTNQRSLKNVKSADVVVVNPTHFAVAIQYQSEKMDAPKVVAKGADRQAERIRELARKHGVPVLSRPPLARFLYRHVKVNRTIPPDVYKAVALVLAHVFRLRRSAR